MIDFIIFFETLLFLKINLNVLSCFSIFQVKNENIKKYLIFFNII